MALLQRINSKSLFYDLGKEIKNTIIWRIGESTLQSTSERLRNDLDYIQLGREELQKRPKLYNETLNDAAIMEYILEDYQIVISKSIESSRIIRVIPPTREFGRVLYKNKKERYLEE